MGENKKYLTEENYEKGKKTILKIAIAVLVIGIVVGVSLIVAGVLKINSTSKNNNGNTIVEENNMTLEEIDLEIAEIDNQINEINQNINSLKAEKSQEFTTNGFSEKYYQIDSEIETQSKKISDLNQEKFILESKKQFADSGLTFDTDNEKGEKLLSKGYGGMMIMGGVMVLIFTAIISGKLFMIYKRREILAFTAQQVIPVAQEGIDEMAPAIGNVAKEISKGIASGKKDADQK